MKETRYVVISLTGPGVGEVEASHRLFDILNHRDGLGWEAGLTLGRTDFLIYRDVDSDDEFQTELSRLREVLGGEDYARETNDRGQPI